VTVTLQGTVTCTLFTDKSLSLGGCEPQLKGHIQTNINVGNDKETMLSVVTQLFPYVGYPRTLNAIRCINEVLPE
jgi:4-carboxymuconolactone decarboxylase